MTRHRPWHSLKFRCPISTLKAKRLALVGGGTEHLSPKKKITFATPTIVKGHGVVHNQVASVLALFVSKNSHQWNRNRKKSLPVVNFRWWTWRSGMVAAGSMRDRHTESLARDVPVNLNSHACHVYGTIISAWKRTCSFHKFNQRWSRASEFAIDLSRAH